MGKVVRHFPQLDSTNQYAADLLTKNTPSEGTVISAEHQTAGRGQIGSRWHSAAGKNLTISVIFYPKFLAARQQFSLTQCVALAVRDTIAPEVSEAVTVKWPNDIYVGPRKIAGILLQNSLSGQLIQTTIAGIGLNVNQAAFPANLPNPTSLYLETGRHHELDRVLQTLCRQLEFRYLQLKQGQQAALKKAYLSHLYRFQTVGWYENSAGQRFQGTITGVNEAGKLEVLQHGQITAYGLKEIRFII